MLSLPPQRGIMILGSGNNLPSPARGRGAGGEGEGKTYPLQYTLHLQHHLVIPKPQQAIALSAQPCIPTSVVAYLRVMLPAVEFNDQSLLHADKIDDVAAYGFLSLEFNAHKAMRPQVIPQPLLDRCWVAAHGFGVAQHSSLSLDRLRPPRFALPASGRGECSPKGERSLKEKYSLNFRRHPLSPNGRGALHRHLGG